jgi:hydroxymethylpyrimidine/phosphomethylpyrimidine kinase
VKPPRILIIAGSDSGGGAGIQADIKTVTMLGGFATTAVTAITAQNTLGVSAVMPVPAEMVLAQIDAVAGDIGIDAVKIGMIGSAETVHAVADRLEPLGLPIVFDPVMVATSGSVLADDSTIAAFSRLMRISTLATPNIPELSALIGRPCDTEVETKIAAEDLASDFGCAILAKGGHRPPEETEQTILLPGGELTTDLISDWLIVPPGQWHGWSEPRIDTRHTHGTGCTLASAVATGIAFGLSLPRAVEVARLFVRVALREAPGLGGGHGPMGHQRVRLDIPDSGGPTLNQATLPALDYNASVAFYRRLGLRQIVDSPGRYARFECPGGATLSIHVEPGGQAGDSMICFESDDLDALVVSLRAAGIAFEDGPEDRRWGWREARLRDPAGNRLCLYRAGEYRRFPPWRIG